MIIEIPDEKLYSLLADLQKNKKSASTYLAKIIERSVQEKGQTEAALVRMDKDELDRLSDTLLPGYNRFRVLCALKQLEEGQL